LYADSRVDARSTARHARRSADFATPQAIFAPALNAHRSDASKFNRIRFRKDYCEEIPKRFDFHLIASVCQTSSGLQRELKTKLETNIS